MKKAILFIFAISLSFIACKRKTSCTCKDADGKTVSYSELTSDSNDRMIFESECSQKKVLSYKDSTQVYTPCEVTK
jgi:hypothetical protein